MATKLEEVRKQAQIDLGATLFFENHPELWPADANTNILALQVIKKGMPLDKLESWNAAYADCKNSLCAAPAQQVTPEAPAKWDYPFPEFHTSQEARQMPRGIFNAFYFDKNHGVLSPKAIQFREYLQAVIDRENRERGGN